MTELKLMTLAYHTEYCYIEGQFERLRKDVSFTLKNALAWALYYLKYERLNYLEAVKRSAKENRQSMRKINQHLREVI
ncbi:hypothetical protein [Piscibacillus halophilus]|uniref:hypothetical protein n=1 Tax=Piscibacillus halophilus TaxID=571933 RepID=UPI00158F4738|nr:hypothetical protein [Piscibacillus halophilus]